MPYSAQTERLTFDNGLMRLFHGDALAVLRTLPDESVHCCVTSPPYLWMRDYGTAAWKGGDPACDHQGEPMRIRTRLNQNTGTGIDKKNAEYRAVYRSVCGKCGAKRHDKQIGLEESVEQYVKRLVAVFREVYRVLRKDGTCFINIGDSYAGSWKGGDPEKRRAYAGDSQRANRSLSRRGAVPAGLKPKDLIGVPWEVARALRNEGFYLRNEIIWHKPNPMPSSVKDRFTTAHEQVFFLTKSRHYYFDRDAVAEPCVTESNIRNKRAERYTNGAHTSPVGAGTREWNRSVQMRSFVRGRNKRDVWTIATRPYRGAHFAVMPPELARTCILAGCPVGGTVLDPFVGSGTTMEQALKLGCLGVGIDLSRSFLDLAVQRASNVDLPLFGSKGGSVQPITLDPEYQITGTMTSHSSGIEVPKQ